MHLQKTSAVLVAAVAAAFSLSACTGGGAGGGAHAGAGAPVQPSSGADVPASPGASANSGASASPGGAASPARPGDPSAAAGSQGPGAGDAQASASADGSSAPEGGFCRTSQLRFGSSRGTAEGEVLINLTNAGSSTCTMHGFPGLDLRSKDGTVSAARGNRPVPVVTLAPGEGTGFPVRFPPNDSGGSGVAFTSAVVTPPNETHAHRMPLSVVVPAGAGSTPRITVEPVGSDR
ncbi:DUF4232 domain-containing protein [Streptomyces sp. NPDC086010]|uniref:DUF4232 domain-containing protein n=1 Tax=Streptomyces sp. NPDC086010 TaxID=3365745 RepID=UPI0037D770C1